MDGLGGGGGGIQGIPNPQDLKQLGATSTGGAVFDASQYSFFGNGVVEEVELGGLEDEDENAPVVGFDEEEYQLDQGEAEALGVDDLSATFSKAEYSFMNEPSHLNRSDQESEMASWRLNLEKLIKI